MHIATPPFDAVRAPQCTLGFMFRSRRERYLATAGHCVQVNGERRFEPGSGPLAYDRAGQRIGEVAYSAHASGDHMATELDLALIRLDRGLQASPEMCHFGGPTGVNDDLVGVSEPVRLHYYGNTFAGGYVPVADRWLLPARTGVATGLPDRRRVHFHGHAAFFDSGAPVISHDRRALALISGPLGADASGHAGLVVALRLPPMIERAETVLRQKLELVSVRDSPAGA